MDEQTISIAIFVVIALVIFAVFRKLMSLLFLGAIGMALFYFFS